MGTDQIATIRPAILEAIEGAPDTCVTLEVESDSDRWVQFVDYTINAAYPYSTDPQESMKSQPVIDGIMLVGWEPQKFTTFKVSEIDAMTLARWIDAYFVNMLDSSTDYDLDVSFEEL